MSIYPSRRLITLDDTAMGVIVKLSQGNPGAATACVEIMKQYEAIDPQAFMGGLGVILAFDDDGLYGEKIWMIYNDVCGRSVLRLAALLRARQMGQLAGITSDVIRHAIENRGDGIDHDAVLAAVRDALPLFSPNTES